MIHSYYIAGHSDDALLFRGQQLYIDQHTQGAQVVHITTTAGDAGRTDGWWQAREQGNVAALNASMGDPPVVSERIAMGGRQLTRYRAANWFLYPLRLPDGGLDGNGFGHGSLTQLRNGQISSLTPLDGSAPYRGWSAFVSILRAIMAAHRDSGEVPWANTADPSSTSNPGDHPDHYATAAAVDSIAGTDNMNAWYWVSYDTQHRPANLGGFDLEAKRFLFAAYGWETGGPNEQEWSWWGQRDYGRVR
ncbi:GlcNAc-PI de-N-acetylase [Amycolatopsis sp. K13G38]|uniref:GlcNAc-PI de-N-acetylase n=1 Tax=Amycolatopsis acididurans TaxID=2724524 RepID=A0ABX1J6J7_9PSEU|nr:PIG-L family deacetylase [Amycolatopsis acididurans]NKQ54005.1 GlcNAc-PI de-N-acetylase [Amycolatopsis acididurans]